MAISCKLFSTTILILLFSNIFLSSVSASRHEKHNNNGLRVGFYKNSCPQAEKIVLEAVRKAVAMNPGIAAGLLRLYFHDCFVKGCDASILLDTTPSGEKTEKTSPGNVGVRGFEVIDEAKALLEEQCPDTVSCADIMAFAARDAVFLSGISRYRVPSGRRDGLVSLASNVFSNLPIPDADVDQMEEIFAKKGMTKEDIVVLLGAHSIGVAHCFVLDKNFYNFNATHKVNPKINDFYAAYLRTVCPPPGSSQNATLSLNLVMPDMLSNVFYANVMQGKAAIPADQSLLDDIVTKRLVEWFHMRPIAWSKYFRKALVKLGNVEVLTGQQGQIRKSCRAVNN